MKLIYDDGTEKDFGDEPIFVVRAQDKFAPMLVETHIQLCVEERLFEQASQSDYAYREIVQWQHANPERVKLPDHKHRHVGLTSANQNEEEAP